MKDFEIEILAKSLYNSYWTDPVEYKAAYGKEKLPWEKQTLWVKDSHRQQAIVLSKDSSINIKIYSK